MLCYAARLRLERLPLPLLQRHHLPHEEGCISGKLPVLGRCRSDLRAQPGLMVPGPRSPLEGNDKPRAQGGDGRINNDDDFGSFE